MSSLFSSRETSCPAAVAVRPPLAWGGPLVCFLLPLSSLAFFASGPHGLGAALCWTLPVWLCVAADYFSPKDRADPRPAAALERWLDARLPVLFVLQWLNIALMLDLASRLNWGTPAEFAASAANVAAMRVLVGTTSCCSGIAVAHELIHRRARILRQMGRILLWTVCYDHFALAHGRGHHRLASTLADPATARFGERFKDFFWRSLRGQWLDAWRAESKLRKRQASGWRVWLSHRIVQGLLAQLALLALIAVCFGKVALLMFLYQAWVAVRMLEAVNYVQHWGLLREGERFGAADAWATDSWFSLHSFIGLSRHADHHAHADRPCHRLRHHGDSPPLPHGYFVMVLWVRLSNDRYVELAKRVLRNYSEPRF